MTIDKVYCLSIGKILFPLIGSAGIFLCSWEVYIRGLRMWQKTVFSHNIARNLSRTHARYHYDDVTMSLMASQITSLTIVYSTVYSGADQKKHQSSASLAFVRGIHQGPVNSEHKWPVTRKMFPFDDVIMLYGYSVQSVPRIRWNRNAIVFKWRNCRHCLDRK